MKKEIYKSGNLLYILISQYRISVVFIISILIICLTAAGTEFSNNSEYTFRDGNVKLGLHCPEVPPLFQKINTGENNEYKNKANKDIDQDWYSKVIGNILKDEYNISYFEKTGNYESSNKANDIRFVFHKDGITAVKRQTSDVRRQTSEG